MTLRCEGARVRKDLRRQQLSADAVVCRCFLCRGQFRCGPGRYDGRGIPEWDIGVCRLARPDRLGMLLERFCPVAPIRGLYSVRSLHSRT